MSSVKQTIPDQKGNLRPEWMCCSHKGSTFEAPAENSRPETDHPARDGDCCCREHLTSKAVLHSPELLPPFGEEHPSKSTIRAHTWSIQATVPSEHKYCNVTRLSLTLNTNGWVVVYLPSNTKENGMQWRAAHCPETDDGWTLHFWANHRDVPNSMHGTHQSPRL